MCKWRIKTNDIFLKDYLFKLLFSNTTDVKGLWLLLLKQQILNVEWNSVLMFGKLFPPTDKFSRLLFTYVIISKKQLLKIFVVGVEKWKMLQTFTI